MLMREPLMHRDHCALDDVGRSSLHRSVDGRALRRLPQLRVAGVDVLQIKTPSRHGFDVALRACRLASALHVLPDSGIALEVEIDVLLGSPSFDAELA